MIWTLQVNSKDRNLILENQYSNKMIKHIKLEDHSLPALKKWKVEMNYKGN